MIALAAAGYRAIAPDLRGYGLSEPHPELEKASFSDFVHDTLAILDHFQIEEVEQLYHDFNCHPKHPYVYEILVYNRICFYDFTRTPLWVAVNRLM